MDFTGTIYLDASDKAQLSVGKVTIYQGETLTISIGDNFPNPGRTEINRVQFWDTDGNGGRGDNLIGTWYRNPDSTHISDPPSGLTVSAELSGVKIKDTETSDSNYYYDVQAQDGSTTPPTNYDADPELVVKKETRPPKEESGTSPEPTS